MKKILFLLLTLLSTTLSFAQDVQKDPFPSNWQQLDGNDAIEIFRLPNSQPTSIPNWTTLQQPHQESLKPPLLAPDYGIYNDVMQKWLATSRGFGFSLINMEDSSNQAIIDNINNNNGNLVFTQNLKGVYWCYIPLQEQTSDFLKIEYVDNALNTCSEDYSKAIAPKPFTPHIPSLTDINPECLTKNKPLTNQGGLKLPGTKFGEPLKTPVCGQPVGTIGAKDTQIPLGQPFPNDTIKIGTAMGVNFNQLPRFCANCSLGQPTQVQNIKIPSSWKVSTEQ
jgi:hypothetical protein